MIQQDAIQSILQANIRPSQSIIKARQTNKELEALVLGVDFHELLIKIEHKEDDQKANVRRKYARSMQDVFERIMRPLDNVYSATGGSKTYTVPSPIVIEQITQINKGQTLESWLHQNWLKTSITDPAGVTMLEYKDNKSYPTYKNIHTIRAYKSYGQQLEWIMFEPTKIGSDMYVRFIDDEFDYMYKQMGSVFTLDEEKTFKHPYGYCPCVINSALVALDGITRLSAFDNVVLIAKEYLRDLSVKSLYKFLHGFPIFWRYAVQCKKCSGSGKHGDGKCPDCDGHGFYVKRDVTDAVILAAPESNDDVKLAPDIAGFIAPELETWRKYDSELDMAEKLMHNTIWGTTVKDEESSTATGRYIDVQPVINSLHAWADVAEYVEWWLSELQANFYVPTKRKDVSVVQIMYGRNYIIESPTALLQRYHEAKTNNDTTAVLDQLMKEWITAKYKNNPQTLNEELKRIQVEPYIHYTVDQVQKVFGDDEAQEKMMFSRFWVTANKEKTPEQLYVDFYSWIEKQEDYIGYKKETGEAVETNDNLQNTALNGAQITSMVEIVTAVTNKIMPKATATALLKASFPTLTEQQVNDIIAPI